MRAVVGLCLLDLCGSEASLLLAPFGLESSLRVVDDGLEGRVEYLSLYKLEYTYTVRSLFAVGLRTVSVPTHISVRVGSSELTGGGAHERARARAV